MKSLLYYECHVTIEPVFDRRLDNCKRLCAVWGFNVADLLMQKRAEDSEERSKHDTFATSRGVDYDELQARMITLVMILQEHGFKVWRYKIEDTIVDSKIKDELNLLEAK